MGEGEAGADGEAVVVEVDGGEGRAGLRRGGDRQVDPLVLREGHRLAGDWKKCGSICL